jgi:hypothetical protein
MPMTLRATYRLLLVLGSLAGANSARADMIQWSYGSFSFPGMVIPDKGTPGPVFLPLGGPTILPFPFPPQPPGVLFTSSSSDMTGSSHIVLANLQTISFAVPSNPDIYKHQPFDVAIGILDKASNRSKIAIFHGWIDGTASMQFARLDITFAKLQETLHIGHELYTIKIDAIVPPGPPNGLIGAIGAEVTVRHNPEPSSLVLAGLGLTGIGWFRWRRRYTSTEVPRV